MSRADRFFFIADLVIEEAPEFFYVVGFLVSIFAMVLTVGLFFDRSQLSLPLWWAGNLAPFILVFDVYLYIALKR